MILRNFRDSFVDEYDRISLINLLQQKDMDEVEKEKFF
jgi:hypothetical protein